MRLLLKLDNPRQKTTRKYGKSRNIYYPAKLRVNSVIHFQGTKYKVISQSSDYKHGAFLSGYYTTIVEIL